jgi:uncharacterized membrane protein
MTLLVLLVVIAGIALGVYIDDHVRDGKAS